MFSIFLFCIFYLCVAAGGLPRVLVVFQVGHEGMIICAMSWSGEVVGGCKCGG